MELLESAKFLQDNIYKMQDPVTYKNVLNRGNNLLGYDIINRMLIEFQYSNAVDVKTANGWREENREIKDGAKGIDILIPIYKVRYIDTETGEALKDNDLNVNEIEKALDIGLIQKENYIDALYTERVYDIKQTKNNSSSKYEMNSPVLTVSNILKWFIDITGCKVENCDTTYYSHSGNILYLSSIQYAELANNISQILTKYIVANVLKNKYYDTLEKYEKELIEQSMQYSLSTLLGGNYEVSFQIIRSMHYSKLIMIANIIDCALFDIISKLKFKKANYSLDVSSSIERLNKAETLLDIMEANSMHKQLSK